MATLDFKGKTLVQNYHLTVKYHELVPKKDKSLTDKVRLDDNLIIHGDNLKALKALLPTYAGKVKCIYVDVPYNTGNEGWAYNDNVNSPMMQEWLGKVVDREDLTRHDKWLCMMTPRLKLLYELLSHDGVIFISIDDNEVHHLRTLVEEIFPASDMIIWKKSGDSRWGKMKNTSTFRKDHEYVVVGYKSERAALNKLWEFPKFVGELSNPDGDKRGDWLSGSISTREEASNPKDQNYYMVTSPAGKKFSRTFDIPEVEFLALDKERRIYWGPQGDNVPRIKIFSKERRFTTPYSVLTNQGTSTSAKEELREIFGEGADELFPNPKPVQLAFQLIQLATEKDSIVLDSFAGSGTTAHALLALNMEDGGNRKFILVECEDYADKLTAERVRRVIKGVRGASGEQLKKGLGGTFSYFELGKAIELESILDGKNLPSYLELARYVFYTATGEEFDERKVNEKRQFVGESKNHEVYLFYRPDIDYLKKTALTLERAEELGKLKANGKRRLVFAPTKYLDQEQLDALRIDFAQLPFEIYKLAR